MWTQGWRDEVWGQLEQSWDLVVVGGGITGAGILREAARLGLRVLLVEQRDFAWGTSSRSSKLVHGGLRYLAQGKLRLTLASVREREQLLEDGPGLIDPLGFLMATHKGDNPGRWTYSAGLSIYDLMALQWSHRYYSADEFRMLAPHITTKNLEGGFRYGDAQTDDARLVLRVIREAVADGGVALNYATVTTLVKDEAGQVAGLVLQDQVTGQTVEVRAQAVVNATGAWADVLRQQVGATDHIRKLRGSHLIIPGWRLPMAQAVAFLHPLNRRPVFIFPWEGVTVVGTTDIDHDDDLNAEPCISPEEVAYLMAAVTHQFPARGIRLGDIIATFAGVRPVIDTGQEDPSKESREHVVWQENGLLTVTGGKLTTFRVIALDALKALQDRLPDLPPIDDKTPVLNAVNSELPLVADEAMRRRLLGRYGSDAVALVNAAEAGELEAIPGTHTIWAELRWATRSEGVVHLDDLLLRRVRLGLLLHGGGVDLMPRIRAICQPELGWDNERWEAEEAAYRMLWRDHYSLPAHDIIPDWYAMLRQARAQVTTATQPRQSPLRAVLGIIMALIMIRLLRKQKA